MSSKKAAPSHKGNGGDRINISKLIHEAKRLYVDSQVDSDILGHLPSGVLDKICLLSTHSIRALAAPPEKYNSQRELFRDAARLHQAGLFDSEIEAVLRTRFVDYYRVISTREFDRAIGNSKACPPQISRSEPTWPRPNPGRIADIRRNGISLEGLKQLFPAKLGTHGPSTEGIIDALFPGKPWLCCGASTSQFATLRREEWRGQLSGLQFIVPSPMSKKWGCTKDTPPKRSQHTLGNTGPRHYLVIEFDQGTFDNQAAILWHLHQRTAHDPLILAVMSGGKSLHGWFRCQGISEARLRGFTRYTATLGADPTTWTRSQFVRMPDGLRSNGERQEVVFFNPRGLPDE